MRFLLPLLLAALATAQTPPPPAALRLLPYDLPPGAERAAYFTPEGDLRQVELAPNNPSLRIRVAGGSRVMLYEPPSAALTERLKAKLAAEGRPNAPVRYPPESLTPLAEVVFQAPAPRALAVLFPTGKERPRLLGYAMADDPGSFRAGHRRLFNLTQRTVVAKLGKREATLRPMSVLDVAPIGDGDQLVFVPVEIGYLKDGVRRPITATRWAHDPVQRTVVFLYEDPAEGRVRIQACAERTDLPETGEAPAGGAAGFGSRPGSAPGRAGQGPAVAATKPETPRPAARPLTEAEKAEMKARESVDATNFLLPPI